ncbi:MAG: hypothetical protein JSS49_19055 [Planctomycetes bacterium]|nr:hypothetical protein [Planctomycetota bacterium]
MPFPECEHLVGRKRSICRGEADLPLEGPNGTNAYRAHWGLAPLQSQSLPSPTTEPPSLLIRGWNFATAMARWTLAGLPRRTQAEIDTRLAICQSCEFLRHDHCTQCGCACVEQNRLINKLALATETCPLGKWS